MCTDCGSNLKQFFFFAYIPDCLASLLRLSTTLSSFEPFCMPEIPAGSVADCKRDELLPKLDSLKSITKKKRNTKIDIITHTNRVKNYNKNEPLLELLRFRSTTRFSVL